MFAWIGELLTRRRGPASLLLAALTLAAMLIVGLRSREGPPVDFTPQALFATDPTTAARLERLRGTWGRDDNDLLVLLEGEVFSPRGERALARLAAAIREVDGVAGVRSLLDVPVPRHSADGTLAVAPLLPPPAGDYEAARRRALADALVGGWLVADGGRATLLQVRLDPDLQRIAELAPAVRAVRRAVEAASAPLGATLTGVPAVRVAIVDALLADQARFLPLDTVLFVVFLLIAFRGALPGILPLVTVGLAVLWSVGLLLALGVTFNVLSALLPTLVLVIGLSDGVHLLVRHRLERASHRPAEATARTLRHLGRATLLTSVTTAIGFGSLVTANSQAVRAFAWQTALAVLVTWVATVLALPTLLAWVERPAGAGRRLVPPELLAGCAALATRRPGRVLAAAAILTGLAGAFATRVHVTSYLLELFPDDHPVVADHRRVVRAIGGTVPFMVHLEAEDPEAFRSPEVLDGIARLAARLEAEPGVGPVLAPTDVLAEVHAALGGRGLPADPDALAQVRFVAELAGLDAAAMGLSSRDGRRQRIVALADDLGGPRFLELRREMAAEGEAILAAHGIEVVPGGDAIQASAGIQRVIVDLVDSVGLAALGVFLALLALTRAPRLAALSMVPNLAPLVFTLAALALLGGELSTTNVFAFAVALGLAVDNTIHLLARFQEACRDGLSRDEAIREALVRSGPAILVTTFLLLAGLGVLVTSDFRSTRHFAVLSVATLLAALGADLLVLPALLRLGLPGGRRAAALLLAGGLVLPPAAARAAVPAGPGGDPAALVAEAVRVQRPMAGVATWRLSIHPPGGGPVRTRTLRVATRIEGERVATRIALVAPAALAGTRFLSVLEPGRPPVQAIWLPAVGATTRIAARDRDQRFLGSDFTYADLAPLDPAAWSWTLVQAGGEVLAVRGVDRSDADRAVQIEIERATRLPRTVTWYAGGRPRRRLHVAATRSGPGGPRPVRLVLDDLASGGRSELELLDIDPDPAHLPPPDAFAPEALAAPLPGEP